MRKMLPLSAAAGHNLLTSDYDSILDFALLLEEEMPKKRLTERL